MHKVLGLNALDFDWASLGVEHVFPYPCRFQLAHLPLRQDLYIVRVEDSLHPLLDEPDPNAQSNDADHLQPGRRGLKRLGGHPRLTWIRNLENLHRPLKEVEEGKDDATAVQNKGYEEDRDMPRDHQHFKGHHKLQRYVRYPSHGVKTVD